MLKLVLRWRQLLPSTRGHWLNRVFFAVYRSLLATPVVFYTRAYARVARVGSDKGRRQQLGSILLGVALLASLALSLSHPAPARAAVSDNLNFQARLEGINGAIANDGDYNVEFKLYKSLSGGGSAQGVCVGGATDDCLWVETRIGANKVRVVNGYLTVNLGSVTSFPPSMVWDQSLYITMNVGGTGAPSWDGEMSPRLKLTAVPYAFQAKNAERLQVISGANVGTLSFITPTATRNILLPDASGTLCLDSVVNNCNYALASGSNAYIQNGTSLQGNANFNIQSAATTSISAVIQARTSQTADLLQFKNSAGTAALAGFNNGGRLYYQSGSFTGTILQDTLTANTNYHLPDTGAADETICTVSTCTGGAGGSLSSTGTVNHIARFTSATNIGNSLLYDDLNFIGLGTTTNSGLLSIAKTVTNPAVDYNLVYSYLTVNPSGNSTSDFVANNGGIVVEGANDVDVAVGSASLAYHNGTGTVDVLTAISGEALSTDSGDVDVNTGISSLAGIASGGTGTILQNFGGKFATTNQGGTITDNYGVIVGTVSNTGSITNNYGLYLQDQSASGASGDNFNFYSAGATASNLIEGQLVVQGVGGLTLGSAVNAGLLTFSDGSSGFNGIITQDVITNGSDITFHLPDVTTGPTQTICTVEEGNCAGSGTGITGSGTTNFVARFNSGSTINSSSLLYDNGSFIGVGTTTNNGLLSVQATSASQRALFAHAAASATTPVAVIRGGATPAAGGDLLQLQLDNGSVVASFDATGKLILTAGADIAGTTTINTTGTANTSIGNATGNFSLTSSALNVTTAGALSGITTIQASGGITAATTGNTINGLIINGGALSGITGYTQGSGNFAISGSGTFSTGTGAISLNGNTSITGTNTLTVGSGAVTLGSLGAGLVQSNASGLLSSGAVDRNSGTYFTNALSVANGGTGASSFSANGILYGNGSSAIQVTSAAADSVLVTNGSNVPSLSQTLPVAVQGNITQTGALSAGSIASGFGVISTANNITTSATLQGNIVNATTGFRVGGAAASGNYLRGDGTNFVSSALQAADISGTLFTVAGTAGTNQTISAGDTLSILRGGSNNLTTTGSATDTITVDIVSNPTFAGLVTAADLSVTNGATIGGGLDVTGTVNFRQGSDFSTNGTSHNVAFGSGSLIRLTGSAAQTITGIAGGTNGRLLTLVNAGAATATISNNSGSSLAVNRITTGTGANISLPVGASVKLVYDSTDSLWRVVGSVVGNSVSAVGTLDSQTKTTDGAVINGNTLYLQSADASFPGLVTTGLQTFAGDKTFTGVTTFSGNVAISGTNTLTVGTGAVTLGSLGAGLVQSNASGLLSSGAVDRNSSTYFNTALTVANGGTGVSTLASNGILYGNGTGNVQVTSAAANSVLITDGSSVPSLSQTLPTAVQDNITRTGALASGSITTGFGTISTGNNITTTATLQGGTLNVTGSATVQGSGGLTLGVVSTTTGKAVFANAGGSGSITLQGNNPGSTAYTLNLPAENGTLCSTGSICSGYAAASPSGNYVQFAPAGAQVDSSTNSSIFINKTGASGNILQLQNGGTDRLVVANNGNVTASGTVTINNTTYVNTNSATALKVEQSGVNNNTLVVDTAAGRVGVGSAAATSVLTVGTNTTANTGGITFGTDTNLFRSAGDTLRTDDSLVVGTNLSVTGTSGFTGLATFNGGLTVASGGATIQAGGLTINTGQQLTNAGSTLFTAINIADKPSGGNIGTAAATVDVATTFNVDQQTSGQNLTLPNPTSATSGRLAYVNNVSTNSTSFTMGSATLNPGSGVVFIWNGSAWVALTSGSSVAGVTTIGALDTPTTSADGAHISGNILYLQSATASVPGLVNTTSQTFAGDKTFSGVTTFNGNVSISGTNTLTVGTGAVTLGSLGAGLVQSSAGGLLSSGAVDRNSATFFNTALTVANGGTGATSFTANGVLFGNTTGAIQATAAGTDAQFLLSNAGTPVFRTLSGDASITNTGALTINSLQGNTLTISSPASGQFLKYNGSAFVNSAITAADVTGTLFTLAGTTGTSQNVTAGSTVTIARGTSNNLTTVAGATNTVTVDIVQNPTFTDTVTLSKSNGVALDVSGTPTPGLTTSLVKLGGTIASGNNTAGTGGTYLGINSPAAGAGSTADFLNFQSAGTVQLKVTNNGTITAGGLTNGGSGGIITSNGSGVLSSGALDRNNATYFNTALTVANGGTGVTSTTAYGLLTGGTTATGAFQNAGTGSSGQILQSGGASALPTWVNATGANTCTDCLIQNPLTSARNTITPTTNSVIGLTVNGTSGTAATAVNVVQGGAATGLAITSSNTGNGQTIDLTNTSGTQTSGLAINRNGAGGTTTSLLDLSNTAGTVTNAILLSGTYTNYINAPNLVVTNAGNADLNGTLTVGNSNQFTINATGAITAATGITSSGSIQFSGLNSVGLVRTDASGNLATGAVDRNSATLLSNALNVSNGGTGLTTTTAYGLITGGTTATGNFQNAGTGSAGQILQSNGASALPSWVAATGASTCSDCLIQNPLTSARNTITPTTNSVVGLTVNGTSGTAATAASIVQGGAALALGVTSSSTGDGTNINLTNTAGTQTNGLAITRNGAGGTTTNLLTLANSAGTATNALNITGTFTNYINAPNLVVTNAGNVDLNGTLTVGNSNQFTINATGAITAATGITSSGAIQFSGLNSVGLVRTDASGNLATGAVDRNSATLLSNALNVSNGGTGLTSTTAYGLLTGGTTSTGNLQNAGTGSSGQILQSGGASALPTWVNATAANVCTDCLIQNPLTTARNTIAPTTNSVVGLTVKGTTGTAANVLEIFNSNASPTLQAYFDTAGALNVSQAIRPTANNTIDLGLSGTSFRTAYLATSVVTPLIDTAATLSVGTGTATAINIGKLAVTTTNVGNLTIGASAGSGTTLTNNGSTVNATLALSNFPSGGSIGTAADTVDKYTAISIDQQSPNRTLTIPSPTASTAYGRVVYISNVGSTNFTMLGATLNQGSTATIVWSNTTGGASWQFAGADGTSIVNQNSNDQTANFRISGTGRANTSFISPLFDALSGGALSVGTSSATGVTIAKVGVTTTIGGALKVNSLTTAGLVLTDASGNITSGAVDRNSATYFNTALTVPNGGTGVTSTTAYGLLAGGTTSTGALQNVGTGNSGQILQSNGASALPSWVNATAATTCTDCLRQVPTSSAENTVTPTANSVVGLTVNGTSGTATTAVSIVQGGAALALGVTSSNTGDGQNIDLTNTAGTQTNGLAITRNGAGGTTTNLLNLTNTAGTVTNAILLSGTYTNYINAPNLVVTNAGNVDTNGTLTVGNSNQFTINATGAITAATGLTSSGAIQFSGLNTAGVVHTDASGVLSTGPVVLGTETTGTYVAALGAVDGSGSANANGATITSNTLYLQSATGSFPGVVNTGAQTFGGTKTFNSNTTGVALTGTPLATGGNTSLLQLANPISGGNTTANGGTYIGINQPNSGAGSVADFLHFQTNGTTKAKIDNAGGLTLAGSMLSSQNTNAPAFNWVNNSNAGTAAASMFILGNDVNFSSALTLGSSGYTGTGGANSLNLINGVSGPINLFAGGSNRLSVSSAGTVRISGLNSVGIVQTNASGDLSTSAVDRNSATLLSNALNVSNGGTGIATTTAYGLLTGGTTATGAFQNAGTGSSGQILQSNGASALPSWVAATGANLCTDCLIQNPLTSARNTITPTTNSVTGLTVNGTSGTAATAVSIVQGGAATGLAITSSNTGTGQTINLTNTSGTQASGLALVRNGAGGTTTSLLDLTNTAGTVTNGINFTGTYTNYINAPNLVVTNAGNADLNGTLTVGSSNQFTINATGAITAATGITSSGAIQFSGLNTVGLVQTNGSGTLSTGAVDRNSATLLSNALNVSNGGTGVATTTAYGLLTGGTTATGAFQNAGTGSSGQILKSNGASALPTWVNNVQANVCSDCATTTLNNLGTTAINASLLAGSGNSIDLGSSGTPFRSGYFGSRVVLSGTASSQLQVTGNPAASGISSLVQLGSALANGNSAGTYLGINSPSGSTYDFLHFEKNGVVQLQVSNAGLLNATGGYAMGADTGISANCSGGQVLSGAEYNGGIVTSGTCSSPAGFVTLQDAYNNSAATNPQIVLNNSYGGLKIADDAGTAVGGNLFQVTNAAGSSVYLGVNSSGITTAGTLLVSGTSASSIAGQLNLTSSGTALNVTGNTIMGGFLRVGSTQQFQVDASGNTSTTASFTAGPDADHRFQVSGSGTVTNTYKNSSNSTAATYNVTNQNAGTGTVTVNAIGINLIGTTNGTGGADITNAINFANVNVLTGNTFNGLVFGSGYNDLIKLGGTALINGSGKLQDAAIDSGLTYTNLQKVGVLNAGSITNGFGTISTTNNITTTAALQGNTLAIGNASSFDRLTVDASGNLNTVGTVTTGTTGQFQITNVGNVSTSGRLTLSRNGTGSTDYTLALTGTPVADGGSAQLRLANPIVGGNAAANGGTYIGINEPLSGAGSAADFIHFQNNDVTQLRVTSSGAVTANGHLDVLNGGATISGALSASTTVNAGSAYRIGGGAGTAGQFLRSDGSTGFVASALQGSDGSGVFVRNVPSTTAENTIAPTAASVVALTIKGTTGTAAKVLSIFDSTASPVEQAYFDNTGSLNVSKLIQATANNTIDFGTTTNNFRTGYFGTSMVVPSITTLAQTVANGVSISIQPGNTSQSGATGGNVTVQGGNNTNGTSGTGGSVTVDSGTGTSNNGTITIGGTNARSIALGNTNASTIANFAAGTYLMSVSNGGVTIDSSAAPSGSDLLFGNDFNRTISVQSETANNNGRTLSILAGAGSGTGNGANLVLQGGAKGASGTTAGTVVVKANGTDGTAFQVQNNAGTALLSADTASANFRLTVGSPTINITGTSGNLAVAGAAQVNGNLYIGTGVTDYATFDGTTHELTLFGTARHAKVVVLAPEFQGAVLTGDGSANLGTMTSDFCSSTTAAGGTGGLAVNTAVCATNGDEHNYYTWFSSSGTNDYDIYTRWQVPSDWSAFNGNTTFSSQVGTGSDSAAVTIYNGNTQCATTSSSSTTWQNTAALSLASCGTITAGTTVLTIKVKLTSTSATNAARIGEIKINYFSKY